MLLSEVWSNTLHIFILILLSLLSSLTLCFALLCFALPALTQTFLAATVGINVANMSLWVHGRTTKNLNWQIESSIKAWLTSVSHMLSSVCLFVT
jgi:hypothetical protein